jgi:phytol kinase
MNVQDPVGMVRGVAIVSLIATIVESLPINKLIDDNISVPIGAILAGLFFL